MAPHALFAYDSEAFIVSNIVNTYRDLPSRLLRLDDYGDDSVDRHGVSEVPEAGWLVAARRAWIPRAAGADDAIDV